MPRKSASKRTFIAPEPDDLDLDEDPQPNVRDVADALEMPVTDNALAVPLFADTDGRTVRSVSQLRLYKLEAGGPPAYKGTIPTSSTLETIGQMFGNGLYNIEGLNHRHTVLASKENIRISLDLPPPEPTVDEKSDLARIERLARASAVESVENAKAFVQFMSTQAQLTLERDRAFYASQAQAEQQRYQQQLDAQRQADAQRNREQQIMFAQTMAMMSAQNNVTIRSLEAMHDPRKRGKDEDDGRRLVDTLLQGMKIAGELRGDAEPEDEPMWAGILKGGLGMLGNVAQQGTLPALTTPAPQQQPTKTREPNPRQQKLLRKAKRAMNFYDEVRRKGIDPDDLLARLSELESTAAASINPPDLDGTVAETPPVSEPSEDDDDIDEDDDTPDIDDDEDEDEDDDISASDVPSFRNRDGAT